MLMHFDVAFMTLTCSRCTVYYDTVDWRLGRACSL